ncbi:MAG: histidine kinase [Desulfosarcinaceae bacterium]|nr:histidine kinase [Desulfosarcinaceae bacterium]
MKTEAIPVGIKWSRQHKLLSTLLVTVLFNTAIAGLLAIVGFGRSFGHCLVFSQCIGLTICLFVSTGLHRFQTAAARDKLIVLLATLSLGAVTGTGLGAWVIRMMDSDVALESGFLWRVVGISILFGLIITYFFYARQQLVDAAELLNAERIRRLAGEKQILEADLKRLQAQIEPHFLFNTLSNIVSLMEEDPGRAKRMQLDLIRYLRTSLRRTRDRTTTLGQEAQLLTAYLDIYKIRMGKRLSYGVDIPPDLRAHPFTPLLLQPLVENAVIHGLEPKIDGGRIRITAERREGWLQVAVSDDGLGMSEGIPPGMGLTNVRERLESLFTPPGRLVIEPQRPSGVRALLAVPLDGTGPVATCTESADPLVKGT